MSVNLDLEAARTSQQIIKSTKNREAKDVENLVTKTQGVLQENGVYACMLYLLALTDEQKKQKEIGKKIREHLLEATKQIGKTPPSDGRPEEVLNFLSEKICTNTDDLLLTKQLWEHTLTYARYGAKARR